MMGIKNNYVVCNLLFRTIASFKKMEENRQYYSVFFPLKNFDSAISIYKNYT